MKKLLAGLALACMTSTASAAYVVSDSLVTGDELAGLEVTVTYADTSTESLTFINLGPTSVVLPGTPSGDTVAREALVGGAFGVGIEIQQRGDSEGNTDGGSPPTVYGLWTIVNKSSQDILSIMLSGMNAMVAFDKDSMMTKTPGSGGGRAYLPDPAGTAMGMAAYSDQVDMMWDDLFFTMTINFDVNEFIDGTTLNYLADVDQVMKAPTAVPAPAGLALLGLGLVALARRRKS